MENAFQEILCAVGEDLTRDGLVDTQNALQKPGNS